MSRWVCPGCDREFIRPHQAHVCVPSCTVEESFDGHPAQLEICRAVLALFDPLHVDPVRVGVFLSHDAKFAELRPKAHWLSLELYLPRTIHDPRITKHIKVSEDRIVHVVPLIDVHDLDETVQEWLTEAYLNAAER
jgi:hypothetical protein